MAIDRLDACKACNDKLQRPVVFCTPLRIAFHFGFFPHRFSPNSRFFAHLNQISNLKTQISGNFKAKITIFTASFGWIKFEVSLDISTGQYKVNEAEDEDRHEYEHEDGDKDEDEHGDQAEY